MIKHKKKNLKPIDMSVSLIYRCPSCSNQHWLSLNQAKTKKFIVVCDCNHVFKVKPVRSLKVIYQKSDKITKVENSSKVSTETIEAKPVVAQIPQQLLDSCTQILKQYGFTSSECSTLITDCYNSNPKYTAAEIIKLCISKLGEKNG